MNDASIHRCVCGEWLYRDNPCAVCADLDYAWKAEAA